MSIIDWYHNKIEKESQVYCSTLWNNEMYNQSGIWSIQSFFSCSWIEEG